MLDYDGRSDLCFVIFFLFIAVVIVAAGGIDIFMTHNNLHISLMLYLISII